MQAFFHHHNSKALEVYSQVHARIATKHVDRKFLSVVQKSQLQEDFVYGQSKLAGNRANKVKTFITKFHNIFRNHISFFDKLIIFLNNRNNFVSQSIKYDFADTVRKI